MRASVAAEAVLDPELASELAHVAPLGGADERDADARAAGAAGAPDAVDVGLVVARADRS